LAWEGVHNDFYIIFMREAACCFSPLPPVASRSGQKSSDGKRDVTVRSNTK
jgi:hypothetical protein